MKFLATPSHHRNPSSCRQSIQRSESSYVPAFPKNPAFICPHFIFGDGNQKSGLKRSDRRRFHTKPLATFALQKLIPHPIPKEPGWRFTTEDRQVSHTLDNRQRAQRAPFFRNTIHRLASIHVIHYVDGSYRDSSVAVRRTTRRVECQLEAFHSPSPQESRLSRTLGVEEIVWWWKGAVVAVDSAEPLVGSRVKLPLRKSPCPLPWIPPPPLANLNAS